MLNLLRMQLRAVFRQKGLYITAAILCFVLLIAFGTMRLVSDPALAERARQAGMEITTDDVSDAFAFQEQTQSDFLGSLLFSGGLMSTLIVIVSSVIVCDDFTTGFGKNIFSYYPKRRDYIFSKLLTLGFVSGFFLLFLTGATLLLFPAAGFQNPLGNPVQLAAMLVLGWAGLFSLCAQNLLFCMLTRRVLVSVLLSVSCALGLFGAAADFMAGLFGVYISLLFPPLNVLATPALAKTFQSGAFLQPGGALLVAFLWTAFYTKLSCVVLNKNDIC